jgi:hypothetical protein
MARHANECAQKERPDHPMKELTPEEMKLISGGLASVRQGGPLQQFIRLIEDFLSLIEGGNSKARLNPTF